MKDINDVYIIGVRDDEEQIYTMIHHLESDNISCKFTPGMHESASWKFSMIHLLNHYTLVIAYISESALNSHHFQDELVSISDSRLMLIPVTESKELLYNLPPRLSHLASVQWFILDEKHTWKQFSQTVADRIFPRYLDDDYSSNYIERRTQSELLSKYLLEESSNKKVVIVQGKAGSGKTTLITKWVNENRHIFPRAYSIPLWMMEKSMTAEEVFREISGHPEFKKGSLIVMDEIDALPGKNDFIQELIDQSGEAAVILASRTIPVNLSKYPVITLDADMEFANQMIESYLGNALPTDSSPRKKTKQRLVNVVKESPVFAVLLSKIMESSSKDINMLLDDIEQGIAIKYDLYITCASEDSERIIELSDNLENAGYLVINPYSNLNVMAYLGNINNIPKFSEKMIVYCSTKGLEQTSWIMQLREQLSVAITNGVEVILIAEDEAICKAFYDKMEVRVLNVIHLIAGGSTFKETVISYFNSLRDKKELMSYADQYLAYGSYQDALMCYEQALQIAEKTENISEMLSLCNTICWIYEEMAEYNLAMQYAEKARLLSVACNLDTRQWKDTISRLQSLKAAQTTDSAQKTTDKPLESDDEYKILHDKIANYCNAAIELFQEMVRQNQTAEGLNCIKVSYTRLMSYCKTVGGMEPFIKTCIQQLDELEKQFKKQRQLETTEKAEKINKSYRTYLGLETLTMDSYDVFLSYKSEDQLIAQRVYEHLISYGKKVFFSCASLPEMGRDEYTDAIFEAMDKAKHMILITSDIKYVKAGWVKDEWEYFLGEIREERKAGNVVLVLHDDMSVDKRQFPPQLRHKEIIKVSEFRDKLLGYIL